MGPVVRLLEGTLPSGRSFAIYLHLEIEVPGSTDEPVSVEDRAYLLDEAWARAREEAIRRLQSMPHFPTGGWGVPPPAVQ
jgi:hypothetical protein